MHVFNADTSIQILLTLKKPCKLAKTKTALQQLRDFAKCNFIDELNRFKAKPQDKLNSPRVKPSSNWPDYIATLQEAEHTLNRINNSTLLNTQHSRKLLANLKSVLERSPLHKSIEKIRNAHPCLKHISHRDLNTGISGNELTIKILERIDAFKIAIHRELIQAYTDRINKIYHEVMNLIAEQLSTSDWSTILPQLRNGHQQAQELLLQLSDSDMTLSNAQMAKRQCFELAAYQEKLETLLKNQSPYTPPARQSRPDQILQRKKAKLSQLLNALAQYHILLCREQNNFINYFWHYNRNAAKIAYSDKLYQILDNISLDANSDLVNIINQAHHQVVNSMPASQTMHLLKGGSYVGSSRMLSLQRLMKIDSAWQNNTGKRKFLFWHTSADFYGLKQTAVTNAPKPNLLN